MMTLNKPKRVVSQASVKETKCFGGCGVTVLYRTTPRVYCDPCKIERKRASARVAMEKQRRKRGVPEIKGTVIACSSCGIQVTLSRNASALRCGDCAKAKMQERSREVSRARKGVPGSRDYHNAWYKNKRHTDPRYAINFRFRAAIRRTIEGKKNGRKWEQLVGYNLDTLLQHLERQFLPGMTWKNRSEWHIDHITPISHFSYTSPDDPEFKAAWALSNLRPLWAEDNISKSARRTHLI